MAGVLLEEDVSLPRLPADFFGQVGVGLAELPRGV